jgi:hypothetical protein
MHDTDDFDSEDPETLTTSEVRAYLSEVLASFPACGPVTLAAATNRAAEALRGRPKDLHWGRTSFLMAECYRRLLPSSHTFRIEGLDMHRIYRDHAEDAYQDALDTFVALGDDLEAARCRAALRDPRW